MVCLQAMLLNLHCDVLYRILSTLVWNEYNADEWPTTWLAGNQFKRALRPLMLFFMVNKTTWQMALKDERLFLNHVATHVIQRLIGRSFSQTVPPWKLISLYVSGTCHLCHVVSPAPVRWGFRIRCCAWCFENATIPASVLAQLDIASVFELHKCRRDFRNVVSYAHNTRKKTRTDVFLLRDILKACKRLH